MPLSTRAQPVFTFGAVLRSMLLAALVAGLVVSAFHLVVTEPVIDEAIALEEQQAHTADAPSHHEEPIVSRTAQKAGLFLGYLLYGASWALLLAVLFHLLQESFVELGPRSGALVFAGLVFWACVAIPFLKYPANPPGVGEADTIEFRQRMYLLIQGLAAIAVVLAWLSSRRIAGSPTGVRRWALVGIAMLLIAGLLYLSMPGNPDPIRAPMELVLRFRLRAIAGLALYWTVFGLSFGWFLARRTGLPARRPALSPTASR
ncbi:MAG TPA: CbtA family protein [Herpetosiphonaceae bacterium]|nr:CbtA family protein [Herpetosiphonaceae bacterium]